MKKITLYIVTHISEEGYPIPEVFESKDEAELSYVSRAMELGYPGPNSFEYAKKWYDHAAPLGEGKCLGFSTYRPYPDQDILSSIVFVTVAALEGGDFDGEDGEDLNSDGNLGEIMALAEQAGIEDDPFFQDFSEIPMTRLSYNFILNVLLPKYGCTHGRALSPENYQIELERLYDEAADLLKLVKEDDENSDSDEFDERENEWVEGVKLHTGFYWENHKATREYFMNATREDIWEYDVNTLMPLLGLKKKRFDIFGNLKGEHSEVLHVMAYSEKHAEALFKDFLIQQGYEPSRVHAKPSLIRYASFKRT